ncbi:hypothetical protein DSLASN_09360 [Desulfoluna limicola]|uniref:Uncharacterized protein n=1 Tax=Desulfoluna limicola TaxID=2810562 RepID=A0ABM7PDR4_9BACT|nr:hypothetical protein DSLASN_09360 [Desulfoluna limicola]
MLPAALPGDKHLKNLTNRFGFWFQGYTNINSECDLPRGTGGEAHSQPAFKVAHLAAGGTR